MKKLIVLVMAIAIGLASYFYFSRPHQSTEKIVQQPLVKTNKATITTHYVKRGKYALYTKVYLPAVRAKLPFVIICPGYSASYKDYEMIAKKLSKAGIGAAVFDFVGGNLHSASGGKMSAMSPSSEEKDLTALIRYFMKQGYCDQHHFYLAGHSQGGLIASLVAAKRKDIRSLFLCAPAYNIPDMVKLVAVPKKGKTMRVGNGEVGRQYIQEMKAIKMYKDVKAYTNPVYIFHGTVDLTVPISYSWDAKEAYKNCHVYPYADEWHVFSHEAISKMCKKVIHVINKQKTEK